MNFAYFLLAKQKTSKSPAAAIERHQNLANMLVPDSAQGFDRLSPNGVPEWGRIRERVFSGSEHKFPEPSARSSGAALRYTAKLRSDPKNHSSEPDSAPLPEAGPSDPKDHLTKLFTVATVKHAN